MVPLGSVLTAERLMASLRKTENRRVMKLSMALMYENSTDDEENELSLPEYVKDLIEAKLDSARKSGYHWLCGFK